MPLKLNKKANLEANTVINFLIKIVGFIILLGAVIYVAYTTFQ